MQKGTIITISRQCGSGGLEIGAKLAQRLGVAYYDKELLKLAAEKSGLTHECVEMYDEAPTNSLLYSLSLGNYGNSMGHYEMPIHRQVFLAQFEALQELADRGEGCVIIGRCADYALAQREKLVRVFLQADMPRRVERIMTLQDNFNEKKAADHIVKTDRRRSGYHNFYADTKWGAVESYDLTVNSLSLGIDNTVELLATYVNMRFPD